ncbi:NUDIX domain-containing protein [Bradyrhizobium sp. ARR65]|uniref:NUDIX domain-containing protein n=1 Tax=Bradyrhizobium sp. ARR65 TaxID=1040989 RepID=UPI000465E0CF|nr:NUDIX domain-containing protein [Bradyrhizobium sp. ARR65]
MAISDYLKAIRAKVGHDLVALTAVAAVIFDDQGRLLLGQDSEMGFWTLPGGAIDPHEQPADAALRECFEETGLFAELQGIIGVFGGPEFLIRYPNGDLAYYTCIAFRATVVGGKHQPGDGEMSALRYFSKSECEGLMLSSASRLIAREAFAGAPQPYFRPPTWTPGAPKA